MDDGGKIREFARKICGGVPGLVQHLPDVGALPVQCIGNVARRVGNSGGEARYGWTFLVRISPHGRYLMATHHAIWQRPSGSLVDITPLHPDEKHRPYLSDGHLLFLYDNNAVPIGIGSAIAPLPNQFHGLEKNPHLDQYLERLRRDEVAKCEQMYLDLRQSFGPRD
jgi:hypothetical protein